MGRSESILPLPICTYVLTYALVATLPVSVAEHVSPICFALTSPTKLICFPCRRLCFVCPLTGLEPIPGSWFGYHWYSISSTSLLRCSLVPFCSLDFDTKIWILAKPFCFVVGFSEAVARTIRWMHQPSRVYCNIFALPARTTWTNPTDVVLFLAQPDC